MAVKVYLGDDPYTGQRIEVDPSMFPHGDDCKICRHVRRCGGKRRAEVLAFRRKGPDATQPPAQEVGFEIAK